MFYEFILTMWKMGRIDLAYLDKVVKAGRITEEEKQQIVATPQEVN